MTIHRLLNSNSILSTLIALDCAASLLHFAHNAVYLHDYPNLPPSLTEAGVWLAWFAVTSVGVLGYWLYRRVSWRTGLAVITLYALLGFGGLDHYIVAPVAAHTVAMNATILIEVAAATLLLVYAVGCYALRGRAAIEVR